MPPSRYAGPRSVLTRVVAGLALIATFAGLSAALGQKSERMFSPSVESKLSGLPGDQVAFLRSRKAGQFMPVEGELDRRLATMTPDEIGALAGAMMSAVAAGKFNAATDMPSIPLNTEAEDFNSWKVLRPQGIDPNRQPGPFSLGRYVQGRGGIPTFFGLPVALTPEDLVAGKVDVAIVGAPLNMGSGTRGAHLGPTAMRTARMGAGNDMYTMTSPRAVLNMVDYGDIAVDNMSTERSMGHVREMVAGISKTGAIPFIIGGDHSLAYSDIAGVTDIHGKPGKDSSGKERSKVTVIHFDSHWDGGRGRAHLIDHGQPVYRLIAEGHVLGRDYIQVGLRAQGPNAEMFEWMREQGMRYHTMVEVEKSGWDVVLKRVLAEAKANGNKVFVSFDVDVLDTAFIVGTGTPVPAGLTMREVVPLIRRICAETELVGFELVELDGTMDPTYKSAQNSAYIVHACLAGLAVRRKGITQENYLSPVSSEWDRRAPTRK
jgi:guanidinobutyrase